MRLARIPIRAKLTLVFSGAIAAMLAVIGVAIYFHFKSGLDADLNSALRARVGDLATLARDQPRERFEPGRPLVAREASFAQILDLRGRVVESSPRLAGAPLISVRELERTRSGPVFFQRGEQSRLLAERLSSPRLVVVAGVSLDQRERAMETLAGGLLVGGPLALALVSALGYALASRALAPVEEMRQQAELMSASSSGARLSMPVPDDELHRLGATLNGLIERMERALQRERAFTADASHELRTPLTILKAEIEVALRRNASVDDLRAALESAGEETNRLIRLADDLLVLARSDEGALPIRRAEVDVRALLKGVADRFELRHGTISVDAPVALNITADGERVERAVANLVENAIRHGSPEVELSGVAESRHVELHVRDRGDGFPSEFLPRAFDRFSRAAPQRNSPGAGLGLAIAEAIARAHGGVARAANRTDGPGADVWITLPRA